RRRDGPRLLRLAVAGRPGDDPPGRSRPSPPGDAGRAEVTAIDPGSAPIEELAEWSGHSGDARPGAAAPIRPINKGRGDSRPDPDAAPALSGRRPGVIATWDRPAPAPAPAHSPGSP